MDQHKFDSSESRLRELVNRRHVLEKKAQLRIATLSEFAAVHDQSLKTMRANAQEQFRNACSRNEQILKGIAGATVSSYEQLREHSDSKSSTAARLREEKRRYQKALASYQPLWRAQELHLEEQKLHMLRQEQEAAHQRRQNWMAEELRAETLKKSLDHERRELMIQLALEEKDKIAADMRHSQAERSRLDVEQVLAQELTNYTATAQQTSAQLELQNEASNAEYIQRSMTLQSNLPLAYGSPALQLPVPAIGGPLQTERLKHHQLNQQGVSTNRNPKLGAGSSHSIAVANMTSALGSQLHPDSFSSGFSSSSSIGSRVGVLSELAMLQGTGEVDMTNISVNSENAPHLQEPVHSSAFPTAVSTNSASRYISAASESEGKSADTDRENKENSSHSGNVYRNDSPPSSSVMPTALAVPVPIKLPVKSESPTEQSRVMQNQQQQVEDAKQQPEQLGVKVTTLSSSTGNPLSALSSSTPLHRSPSMIHQSNSLSLDVDAGGMGMTLHPSTRSPELRPGTVAVASSNDMDEFSLSVPFSPQHHSSPSPSKGSKSPGNKFSFNEAADNKLATNVADSVPKLVPTSTSTLVVSDAPTSVNRPVTPTSLTAQQLNDQSNVSLVPPTPPAPTNDPSMVADPEESPMEHTRHTETWKLIQCAMSLKQLYSRFEELSSERRSSELSTEEAEKRLYSRCANVLIGYNSDPNSSITGEYMQSHVSVGRALNAAFNKRERELVIYGPEVIVLAFLEIVQERAYDIMPLELFNGIVTLDKLHKFYKSGGLGAEETFNAIIQHVRQQVDKKIFSVDEAVKLYTELVLSALLRRDDQDRGRVSRKLTQLLKEAVLNSLSSASGNSFAVSPVKIAATPANTKTNVQAHGTVPGSSVVNKTANSSVKKTANSTTAAFTASKFVSLDDDEFIVEDSPPPRPPPMKDLSMFVETPAKPQEQSQNQGQGQSHGNTNARAAPPPPPAIIDEEEEFDFL